MSNITFGSELSGHSSAPVGIGISDDLLAFTLTYSDFQVEVNNGAGTPSLMAARWEWFALPVTDFGQGVDISFSVSGHAITDVESMAYVMIIVNGMATVERFLGGTAGDILQTLVYTTTGVDKEIRLAVGVVVQADSQLCSAASVTITAVDGNIPVAHDPDTSTETAATV